MAAPVVESYSTVNQSAVSSVNYAKPTGLVAGDLLVAVHTPHTYLSGYAVNTPAGWTEMSESGGTSDRLCVQYKVADSSDAAAASFNFTTTGSCRWVGVLMRISGANAASPLSGTFGTNSGTGSSGDVCPTMDTADNDALVIVAASHDSNNASYSTPPAGFTVVQNAGNNGVSGVAYKSQAVAGPTGTNTWSGGVSTADWWTITFAIAPAAGGTPGGATLTASAGGSASATLTATGAATTSLAASAGGSAGAILTATGAASATVALGASGSPANPLDATGAALAALSPGAAGSVAILTATGAATVSLGESAGGAPGAAFDVRLGTTVLLASGAGGSSGAAFTVTGGASIPLNAGAGGSPADLSASGAAAVSLSSSAGGSPGPSLGFASGVTVTLGASAGGSGSAPFTVTGGVAVALASSAGGSRGSVFTVVVSTGATGGAFTGDDSGRSFTGRDTGRSFTGSDSGRTFGG